MSDQQTNVPEVVIEIEDILGSSLRAEQHHLDSMEVLIRRIRQVKDHSGRMVVSFELLQLQFEELKLKAEKNETAVRRRIGVALSSKDLQGPARSLLERMAFDWAARDDELETQIRGVAEPLIPLSPTER